MAGLVIVEVTPSLRRATTMTEKNIKPVGEFAKEALLSGRDGLRDLIRGAFQQVLDAQMTDVLAG